MKGSLMLLCPYGEACFCVILLISFGIDGIPLLDSITVVFIYLQQPGKMKSAYRLGRNKTENQDHLWQKTTYIALNYSNPQGLSPKWTVPQN